MPVAENIDLVRRWFKEVWNEGSSKTIYELMDPNAIGIGQELHGGVIHGPAEFEELWKRLHGAFPNIKITIEDTFGAGNKVVARWSAEMTHTGGDLGILATDKQVRITGTTIVRIEGGKIVEGWDNWDQLALMDQLKSTTAASA